MTCKPSLRQILLGFLFPDPYKPIEYKPIRLSDRITVIGRHPPPILKDEMYHLGCIVLILATVAVACYYRVWNFNFLSSDAGRDKKNEDVEDIEDLPSSLRHTDPKRWRNCTMPQSRSGTRT